MRDPRCFFASLLLLVLATAGGIEAQDAAAVRSDHDLEALLAERATLGIDLPDLGYVWQDGDVTGDASRGSVSVTHSKVVYYFVHWGPIEVPEVTEEYVRERIPKIWPSEGLQVIKTASATVAGHPAVYAEVMPKRKFYRAFFLIWNCPESGRQFIADMNYNVLLETPRAELQAELDTTQKTLACHPSAPVSDVPGHVIHYENPRYGLSFHHPAHWFVFDNPYGVPHPAYQGLRDSTVGSILALLQDMEVILRFQWGPIPPSSQSPEGSETTMGGALDLLRIAKERALKLDEVDDFIIDAYETLRVGRYPVLKITGTATLTPPEEKGLDRSPIARLMMLVALSKEDDRLIVVSVRIDYHRKDGLPSPPDRSILDHWAVDIASGLELVQVAPQPENAR